MKIDYQTPFTINKNQLTIFKIGLLQIVLGLFMIFMLMKCTGKENHPAAKTEKFSSSAKSDSSRKNSVQLDDNYVPIASYHSEEVKSKLRDLEKLKFPKGTLGDQVLDYLKEGVNDLGLEFKFMDLRFDKRDAVINEKFAHEIGDLAAILMSFPNIKIKLLSYTDNVGEAKANEKLSEDRAMAIQKRLVASGVNENKIVINAMGGKFPVGDNKTYDGRLINNRIEMMILSK